MRPFWIIAIVVCGVFALATVASASVRHEISSAAAAVADTVAAPLGDEASPAPEASTTASPSPSPEPGDPEDGESQSLQPGNHGAAVSAVAGDPGAVGEKALANGKTITNHGQAVSAVARSGAGKPGAAGGATGEGSGEGSGH
ncbi:MAG: hypothetical protein WC709_08440 [Thermoleophilia bacterium]